MNVSNIEKDHHRHQDNSGMMLSNPLTSSVFNSKVQSNQLKLFDTQISELCELRLGNLSIAQVDSDEIWIDCVWPCDKDMVPFSQDEGNQDNH